MILLINRFIIVLLLVLQGFAPLVHAHVHVINSDDGVHIHGITTASSHEHQFSALENISCSNTAIGMHPAITKKKALSADLDSAACYFGSFDLNQFSVLLENTVGFSPPDLILSSALSLSDSAPRGPPL